LASRHDIRTNNSQPCSMKAQPSSARGLSAGRQSMTSLQTSGVRRGFLVASLVKDRVTRDNNLKLGWKNRIQMDELTSVLDYLKALEQRTASDGRLNRECINDMKAMTSCLKVHAECMADSLSENQENAIELLKAIESINLNLDEIKAKHIEAAQLIKDCANKTMELNRENSAISLKQRALTLDCEELHLKLQMLHEDVRQMVEQKSAEIRQIDKSKRRLSNTRSKIESAREVDTYRSKSQVSQSKKSISAKRYESQLTTPKSRKAPKPVQSATNTKNRLKNAKFNNSK
jgi:chromosome segregation ATPase